MRKFILSIALIALAAGCGYSTRSALPGHLRTIYVEPFKNKIDFTTERRRETYFPLLEVKVRNAVIDRFLFTGSLRAAETAADADLVLKGNLIAYERTPLRYVETTDDVREYRVQIVMDVELTDTKNNLLMWEEKGFVGEATYFVVGPLTKSEAAAVDEAMTDLARRLVERTVENW